MKNNFYFIGNFSNIHKKPSKYSEVISQILYGEKFKILSKSKNWIKIKTLFDNYVGYIKNLSYVKKFFPTYKVISLKAKIFRKPNINSKNYLPFGSRLSVLEKNKNYIKIEENKWVKKKRYKKNKSFRKKFC